MRMLLSLVEYPPITCAKFKQGKPLPHLPLAMAET